jgi:8-oxo-dGTP diphosphatase/A/G-specific adenine glycosylase
VEELTHAYVEKTVHLKFFRCALVSGEPRPLDCAAVKWVTRDQLAAHEFPAADAQLLARLSAPSEFWPTAHT